MHKNFCLVATSFWLGKIIWIQLAKIECCWPPNARAYVLIFLICKIEKICYQYRNLQFERFNLRNQWNQWNKSSIKKSNIKSQIRKNFYKIKCTIQKKNFISKIKQNKKKTKWGKTQSTFQFYAAKKWLIVFFFKKHVF